MGLGFGVLGKLGLPSVDTLATQPIHDKFFQDVTKYEDFHKKFVRLCSELSTAMPGKHYVLNATDDEIETLYNGWKKAQNDTDQQKILVLNFLKGHVEEYKASSKAMISTGLVVPVAAVALKRSSQNVPQLKRLRLNFVPNAVFVPTVTLVFLIGVRALNISRAPAKLTTTP